MSSSGSVMTISTGSMSKYTPRKIEKSDTKETIEKGGKKSSNKYNIDALKTMITDLSKYKNVNVESLKGSVKETFDKTKETLGGLKDDDPHQYNLMISHIKKTYMSGGDPHSVKAGSVGAHFYGCLYPGNTSSCSNTCVGSVQPHENTGWTECTSRIVTYNGKGIKINENTKSDNTGNAIVYLENPSIEFKGFSDKDVRDLKSAGITNVTIKSTDKSGNSSVIHTSTEIDQLRSNSDFFTKSSSTSSSKPSRSVKSSKKSSSSSSTPSSFSSGSSGSTGSSWSRSRVSDSGCDDDDSCEDAGSGTGMWIIAAIILLILIIIIAGFAYSYWGGRGSSNRVDDECCTTMSSTGSVGITHTYDDPMTMYRGHAYAY